MAHRAGALSALVGLATIFVPAPSRATPEVPVSLRWTAPEGCPGGDQVMAEVERLLGHRQAGPAKPLDATATVMADADLGFRVHLETQGDGAPRVRELKGASCAAVAKATAMILALAIDPVAVAATQPEPASAASPPPAPTAPGAAAPAQAPVPVTAPVSMTTHSAAPARAPAPPATPAPSRAWQRPVIHVVPWALADIGALRAVAVAAGGTVAVSLGAIQIELGAGIWPSQRATVPEHPAAGGDISLVAGFAGACYDFLVPRAFALGPCAGFELGRLHASGFGVSSPGEGSALWLGPRAGVLFAWFPFEHAGLLLRVDAVVPLARPTFRLDNVGTVHRPGVVAVRPTTGVDVRF